MRTGIVIQARIGSSRLPGKVLKPLSGATMLARVIKRAKKARQPDNCVVVVPFGSSDNPVAKEARSAGADVVRGSEDDVLARFVQAMYRHDLDVVVRLTADNPFVEGNVIDSMLEHFRERDLDYLHNIRDAGYPLGTSVEILRSAALKEAFVESDRRTDHEHVTSYIYDTDADFATDVFQREEPIDNMRLTVDTEKDYRLASWIYNQMESPEEFGLGDVIELRSAYPERFEINSEVSQKSIR